MCIRDRLHTVLNAFLYPPQILCGHGLRAAQIRHIVDDGHDLPADPGRHDKIKKDGQVCPTWKQAAVRDGRNVPDTPVDAVGEQPVLPNGHRNARQGLCIVVPSNEVEQISAKFQIILIMQPLCQFPGIAPDPGAGPTARLQLQCHFHGLSSPALSFFRW